MKNEHFLLKRAYIYEENTTIEPEDCTYNELRGLWVWDKNKEILVKSNHPNCPVQMTKKLNQEDTEDER